MKKDMLKELRKIVKTPEGECMILPFGNANPYGSVGEVFIRIYAKGKNMFYEYDINTDKSTREENKVFICDYAIERFLDIINKE